MPIEINCSLLSLEKNKPGQDSAASNCRLVRHKTKSRLLCNYRPLFTVVRCRWVSIHCECMYLDALTSKTHIQYVDKIRKEIKKGGRANVSVPGQTWSQWNTGIRWTLSNQQETNLTEICITKILHGWRGVWSLSSGGLFIILDLSKRVLWAKPADLIKEELSKVLWH